ncbi:MAG: DUF86 domain-containing protein [Dehalococcoidia bacterium]|nr:DUF86 domain-containing protein [Dehalococcoidia bacterium]
MTRPDDPRKYVWDALQSAKLARQFTAGRSFEHYAHDEFLQAAVERKLEIVGEALLQLSRADPVFAARIPELRAIVAFRNVLAHGYEAVDTERVWKVLTADLPPLMVVLQALLDEG